MASIFLLRPLPLFLARFRHFLSGILFHCSLARFRYSLVVILFHCSLADSHYSLVEDFFHCSLPISIIPVLRLSSVVPCPFPLFPCCDPLPLFLAHFHYSLVVILFRCSLAHFHYFLVVILFRCSLADSHYFLVEILYCYSPVDSLYFLAEILFHCFLLFASMAVPLFSFVLSALAFHIFSFTGDKSSDASGDDSGCDCTSSSFSTGLDGVAGGVSDLFFSFSCFI